MVEGVALRRLVIQRPRLERPAGPNHGPRPHLGRPPARVVEGPPVVEVVAKRQAWPGCPEGGPVRAPLGVGRGSGQEEAWGGPVAVRPLAHQGAGGRVHLRGECGGAGVSPRGPGPGVDRRVPARAAPVLGEVHQRRNRPHALALNVRAHRPMRKETVDAQRRIGPGP